MRGLITAFAFAASISGSAVAQDFAGPANAAPPQGGVLLVTEENAPYNFTDPATGQVIGIVGDLVAPLFAKAELPYSITVMPWSRAIRMAEVTPATCAFSTNMSPERMSRFSWVGPVLEGSLTLFSLGPPAHPIANAEDLKGLRVIVQSEGSAFGLVTQLGMIPLPTQIENRWRMLEGRRAEFIAVGRPIGLWYRRSKGLDLQEVWSLQRTGLGFACSRATDPVILAKLQTALARLLTDGTAASIAARYR